MDSDWVVEWNEEYGYDEWIWTGDGELTREEFDESFMEVMGWYGLTEYDLGFALLGLVDTNGDQLVTLDELLYSVESWGVPLAPEELEAWFEEAN